MTDLAVADAAADFEILRSRLFGIAYRILGGVFDAEDVVQDVWIRWQGTDRARVRDRVAFLVTVTTRVALSAATSSRVRREVSVAGRLSERDFASADPAIEAEHSEEFELAVHLLIERLPPVERAFYVLREAFDYPFRDIAEALGLSESNARQLAYRARRHLAEHGTTRSSQQTRYSRHDRRNALPPQGPSGVVVLAGMSYRERSDAAATRRRLAPSPLLGDCYLVLDPGSAMELRVAGTGLDRL